jgi:AraC family transcriptional regulator of arabinose operon
MNTKDVRKKPSEGFQGEKIVDASKDLITLCQKNPLIAKLFITRMGFYPKAANHYFQRPTGVSQTILIYCTDGKGWINLPNHKIAISTGDMYLIPAGTPHRYGADPVDPWSIYWIHMAGENCNALINSLMGSGHKKPFKTIFSKDRILLFDQIFNSVFQGNSLPHLLFANMSLNYFLASFILPESFSPNLHQGHKIESPTEKAIRYMENNVNKSIVLEDIAQISGLSVSFFSRKFKLDTGYSPVEYLNHIRIQRACQLLHFSKIRINELIFQVGFNDPFYFSRLFKKQMGVSPFEYRKRDRDQSLES